jgi:4'-phosphopantetheinyl transferase
MDAEMRHFTPKKRMGTDEIDVWYFCLAAADEEVSRLYGWCSRDEITRANAFHLTMHRTLFVVGRGLLRATLGWYCRIEPKDIRFGYGANGKPFLLHPSQGSLFFSLAHCEDRALLAVSKNSELGADLERVRDFPEAESIAMGFFSPSEYESLLRVPPTRKTEAFFSCWTRKEAYLKAKGSGLSDGLEEFEVSLDPEEPVALLKQADQRYPLSQWSLLHLNLPPCFIGAIAIPVRIRAAHERRFDTAGELLSYLG